MCCGQVLILLTVIRSLVSYRLVACRRIEAPLTHLGDRGQSLEWCGYPLFHTPTEVEGYKNVF